MAWKPQPYRRRITPPRRQPRGAFYRPSCDDHGSKPATSCWPFHGPTSAATCQPTRQSSPYADEATPHKPSGSWRPPYCHGQHPTTADSMHAQSRRTPSCEPSSAVPCRPPRYTSSQAALPCAGSPHPCTGAFTAHAHPCWPSKGISCAYHSKPAFPCCPSHAPASYPEHTCPCNGGCHPFWLHTSLSPCRQFPIYCCGCSSRCGHRTSYNPCSCTSPSPSSHGHDQV